jgi:hypothetical protein
MAETKPQNQNFVKLALSVAKDRGQMTQNKKHG